MVTKRKEQRIWDNAEEIRKLYFKDPQHRHVQYRKFMNNLFSFSIGMTKKQHDDAPDSASCVCRYWDKRNRQTYISAFGA